MQLPNPMIQIAGVHDLAEARLVIDAGADFIGLPLRLPVHTPDLTEAEAAALIRALPAGIHVALITYMAQADEILAFCRELGVGWVQLHGDITPAELAKLRQAAGAELGIIKSLVVHPDGNLSALEQIIAESALWVDAFITDTFDPATGASGATGRTHNWEISRHLVQLSPRPVILAGGLNPDNVAAAIAAVHPAGVDVHTGIEGADGRKDPEKTRRFLAEARGMGRR